jgi:hypothetical protein
LKPTFSVCTYHNKEGYDRKLPFLSGMAHKPVAFHSDAEGEREHHFRCGMSFSEYSRGVEKKEKE